MHRYVDIASHGPLKICMLSRHDRDVLFVKHTYFIHAGLWRSHTLKNTLQFLDYQSCFERVSACIMINKPLLPWFFVLFYLISGWVTISINPVPARFISKRVDPNSCMLLPVSCSNWIWCNPTRIGSETPSNGVNSIMPPLAIGSKNIVRSSSTWHRDSSHIPRCCVIWYPCGKSG